MKNRKKTIVHMHLPQTEYKIGNNEALYKLFRKRALTKSNDAYIDKGRNPILMILNVQHAIMDVQQGVIVKYKSFKIIYANSEKEEIGFEVEVYSSFGDDSYLLRVFKKGKAYMEKVE